MAELSFAREVQQLRLGAGEEFRGEGILAITKALLESGVGYVAGYQGAPISHLMDVLADAADIRGGFLAQGFQLGLLIAAEIEAAAKRAGGELAALLQRLEPRVEMRIRRNARGRGRFA